MRLQNEHQKNTDIKLKSSGKPVKSDGHGIIEVPDGADAQALVAAGWNYVDEHGHRIGNPDEVRAAAKATAAAPPAPPPKTEVEDAEEAAPAKHPKARHHR